MTNKKYNRFQFGLKTTSNIGIFVSTLIGILGYIIPYMVSNSTTNILKILKAHYSFIVIDLLMIAGTILITLLLIRYYLNKRLRKKMDSDAS